VYKQAISDALEMTKNGGSEVLKLLNARMQTASENLDFEKAAILRDQISAIEKLAQSQTIIKSSQKNIDVIAFAKGASTACAAILRFREGKLWDKREFMFYDTATTDALREEFIPRYYLDDTDEEIPALIACDEMPSDATELAKLLSQTKNAQVSIYAPQRGDNKKLVEMAKTNAEERIARESGRVRMEDKYINELAGLLGLSEAPKTIESYDISNWGDGTSVCGMVVFENGKPKKAGYRHFKIKTVEGTDDYASMNEALRRRALEFDNNGTGQFAVKPDLILIDGGLGQVHAAQKALANTGLANIALYGMVKNAHHKTRGLIAPSGEETALAAHRKPFTFVTNIQDETHRFAISYQRKLAKKQTLTSVLTQINGVGAKTEKVLMAHFKTIKAIKAASESELASVKGINVKNAKAIYNFFNNT
jgi:excinuclease ABC subunit C